MATVLVAGETTTQDGILADRLARDVSSVFYRAEADLGSLTVLLGQLAKRPAGQYQVQWLGRDRRPKRFTLATCGITTDATGASADLKTVESDALRVGDCVIEEQTGEALMVTSKTNATTYVVTRSWGAVAGTQGAVNDSLLVTHLAYSEGAELQEPIRIKETLYTNNTTITRTSLDYSNTLAAISATGGNGAAGGTYAGNALDQDRHDLMVDHKKNLNSEFVFGKIGASGTQRTMSGLIEFVSTYGNSRTDSTSAMTWLAFATLTETATKYNNGQMVVICSQHFATIAMQWAMGTAGVSVQVQNGAKEFGLSIYTVTTPHGTFKLVVDKQLEGAVAKKYAIMVSPQAQKGGGIAQRVLRPTTVIQYGQIGKPQQSTADKYVEELLTEGSAEWGHPDSHFLILNAQTAS